MLDSAATGKAMITPRYTVNDSPELRPYRTLELEEASYEMVEI